ncbi:MAG: hypothetical protein OEV79_12065 [candidate division WOR-3 bacterium]|nr:hypothetical protein [candidate division WOR-3 bacterium]
MGSGLKNRKKKVDMGWYAPTDEEHTAFLWCIKNHILIAPWAVSSNWDNDRWYLEIEIKDKVFRSPDTYGKENLWETMYKFYKYYYDKQKKS